MARRDQYTSQIMALTKAELALNEHIQAKIIKRLDKQEKLVDQDELLVQIVVTMTIIEMKRVKI